MEKERTDRLSDRLPPYLQADPADLARWRKLKFGLLISWGPVSLTGKELGWSRHSRERFGHGETPDEVYDNLYTEFNPVHYDAREWVRIAEEAGVRYMIHVTKHHDGFCHFDTQLTDYKITSPMSPYRKDIVRQLADACHAAGMKFGVYYSQPDWRHPDFATENHARYVDYYHGHVRELLSNYGRVDILWFDGLGHGGFYGRDARDWDAYRMFKMARELQPDIVINNRCGLPGEFDTPEQMLGQCNFERAWESVITLAGGGWSYNPNAEPMSRQKCIQSLASCACGDGSLLLGIGPMPDGRIDARQVERLAEVGSWLSKCGAGIYDTRGGPFPPTSWGGTTYRGDTIYVHVMNWPEDGVLLPPVEGRLVATSLLNGGTAHVTCATDGIRIFVEPAERDEADTVIALTFDAPVPPPRLPEEMGGPWAGKRAWEWYLRVSPVVGCNYLPRTSVNTYEMWQGDTFDPATMDEELAWAAGAGYNSARVFLQYLVWKEDPAGFKRRLDEFLTIASKHGIRVTPVPFCDCSFSGKDPYPGRQDDPVPGVHNSGWVPSPGLARVTDRAEWPELERYIKDLVRTFGDDDRVLMWDLYNEPGASDMWEQSLPLVEATFAWAREVRPKQPLTMGVWLNFDSDFSKRIMKLSDVLTFHAYDGPEGVLEKIQKLKSGWQPILCTEWLARQHGSTLEAILPVFARDKVGWYNWGLVAGRTQTYIHWGSKPGSPLPDAWQHDVFHADGRPYDGREIEAIKSFVENWDQ